MRGSLRAGLQRYMRDVGHLLTGSLGATLLGFLFLPALTRLYPADVLGLYYAFAATVLIGGALATLRFEMAVVVAGEQERPAVFRTALALVAVTSLLLALFLVAGLVSGVDWLLAAGWPWPLLLALPPAVAVSAAALVMQQQLLAEGDFPRLARLRLVQVLVSSGLAVLVGIWWPSLVPLVILLLAGQAVICLAALRPARAAFVARAGERAWQRVLGRYRDFLLWNFPSNALNVASASLPAIVLAARFGPASAAVFVLGCKLFDASFGVLSNAMSQVYFREASLRATAGHSLLRFQLATLGLTLLLALPVTVVILVAGGWLVATVYGNQWHAVAELLPLLLAWRVAQFACQPTSTTFTVLRRQWLAFMLSAVFFLPRVLPLFMAADFTGAVRGYVVASAGFYLAYIVLSVVLSVRMRRSTGGVA